MGYLQNYIKRDNEEKINNYEKLAKKMNPNLKLRSHNLDKDWAGFKKGEIFTVIDTTTKRQTQLSFQTENSAWKYISESYEAFYLAKL